MAVKKSWRLVLVLVGMLISPFLSCFYPVGAQPPSEVASIINQLSNKSADFRRAAAIALGQIGAEAKAAVPQLIELLKAPDKDVRGAAAIALGQIGAEAKAAVPHLFELLKDPDKDVWRAAAEALARISEEIADKNKPDVVARQDLENGLEILDKTGTNREARIRIKRVIDHLQVLERASIISQASTWFQKVLNQSWVTWVIVAYCIWLPILLAIFFVKPLWLLHWNEALKNQLSVKIAPSKFELSIGIPLGYLSLITLMAYHRHVLDAWVRSHIKKARENFNELKTVKDRKVHVSSPVKVDDQFVAEFSVAAVRAHVGRADRQCRWLIVGEGGAGKTSLACQIAQWSMAPDKANRVAPHLMLPVLVEDELDDPATPAGPQRLTEAIRGKLRNLIDSPEPISLEFLKHLLRRLRVIVIIDHLTEMSQTTRDQIWFDAADFPAAALVVGTEREVLTPRAAPNFDPPWSLGWPLWAREAICSSLRFPTPLGFHRLAKAVALAIHLENVAVVSQPVQQCGSHPLALEDLVPLAERKVTRDQHAGTLIPVAEHPKQELHAASTQGDVAEFVADQEVRPLELAEESVEGVLLLFFLQLAHQFRGREETHPQAGAARRQAQSHSHVCFPSSVAPNKTTIVLVLNPFASC